MDNALPSERKVLRYIYDMYASSYPGASPGENDPYLPIDVRAVAAKLKCKPELLFGYLYYYLDRKYGYQVDERTRAHLFALQFGNKRHGVNYPYLAAILSGHHVEHGKHRLTFWMSVAALTLSLAAIIAQLTTS